MKYFNDFKRLMQFKRNGEDTYYLLEYKEHKLKEKWDDSTIEKSVTILEIRNVASKGILGCYIHQMFENYLVRKDTKGEYFLLPFGAHVYLSDFSYLE